MDEPSAAGAGDESRALSGREQLILASIERGLASTDPTFAKIMSDDVSIRGYSPVFASRTSLLVAAMVITMVAAVLIPVSWLAVLATMVVLPAALLWAIERHGFD